MMTTKFTIVLLVRAAGKKDIGKAAEAGSD